MNRRKFFEKAAIGTAAGIIAPTAILANVKKIKADQTQDVSEKIAIDLETISHIRTCDHKLTAAEVLELWRETGILIYQSEYGNPPIPLLGEIEVVDLSKI